MSTKKLSRTVIEGGRAGSNKWERRHSHAEVRAEERDYLKQVMSNLDLAEELEIGETRPVMKEFTDKLSPMHRWIDAQVGRPWSEVHSEIFQKFDTRTTAGRHITFDHLLREIVDTESGFDNRGKIADPDIPIEPSHPHAKYNYYYHWSYADYYVDKDGVLRGKENRHRKHYSRYQFVSEQEYKDASKWLNGRMIGEVGGKLHWFAPTDGIWAASWHTLDKLYEDFSFHNGLKYFIRENGSHQLISRSWLVSGSNMTGMIHSDYWKLVEKPFSFRQRGELTADEAKHFKAFKEKIRDNILSFAKNR
jgi:hypothetical protein